MTDPRRSTRATGNRPLRCSDRVRALGQLSSCCACSRSLFLLPFYLILRNALATDAEITAPRLDVVFPHVPAAGRTFTELFTDTAVPMARSLWNSDGRRRCCTTVRDSCSCAPWPGTASPASPITTRTRSSTLVLATLMIPGAVTFVPSFVMVSSPRLDLRPARADHARHSSTASCAFLFRQYFLNFPKELEEACRIDGLGYWGTFWRIVIPNSKGFLAAIAVITFVSSWNSFLWPLGHRPLAGIVDGPGGPVHVLDRPDRQPLAAVPRRSRGDPAPHLRIPVPPTLPGAGRGPVRPERLNLSAPVRPGRTGPSPISAISLADERRHLVVPVIALLPR